jgi:hypothetical protein
MMLAKRKRDEKETGHPEKQQHIEIKRSQQMIKDEVKLWCRILHAIEKEMKYCIKQTPYEGKYEYLRTIAETIMGRNECERFGSCQYTSSELVYDMLSNIRNENPVMSIPNILKLFNIVWNLGRQRQTAPLMDILRGKLIHAEHEMDDPDNTDEDNKEVARNEMEITKLETVEDILSFQGNQDLWTLAPQIFYSVFPCANTLENSGHSSNEREFVCSEIAGLMCWILRDTGVVLNYEHFCDLCT